MQSVARLLILTEFDVFKNNYGEQLCWVSDIPSQGRTEPRNKINIAQGRVIVKYICMLVT